jgi:hypothetical protein
MKRVVMLASWSWSTNGSATITNTTDKSPSVTGFVDGEVFTVVITDANGCTSSAQTTITVYPEPTASASNSGPVCYDETSFTLNETGGDATSWSWSSNGSATITNTGDQNPTVTGFVDGEIFTVVITDANGCTSSDQTTITIDGEPTATANNNGPVCYDVMSMSLSETGGSAVSWAWSSDGSATITNTTQPESNHKRICRWRSIYSGHYRCKWMYIKRSNNHHSKSRTNSNC